MLRHLLILLAASASVWAAYYSNPIRLNGPDPYIVWDAESSYYYFLTTTANSLEITAAKTLDGLRANPDRRVVYTSETIANAHTVWAPEIHKLDGLWYLYYTHAERAYVLTGGTHPFDEYKHPIALSPEYGLDGTVLKHGDTPFFVWSCKRPLDSLPRKDLVQTICIAKLETPTKLDISRVGVITQPDQEWEQHGNGPVLVNEGPAPLYWNNETYITYSGSFCASPHYSLGIVKLVGDDPLKDKNWKKHKSAPVFSSAHGSYGTGHNGIFYSPDGTEVWNVYHAVSSPHGGCNPKRATFVMKVNTDDGKLDFGKPGYYGDILPGPKGEPDEPESINDTRDVYQGVGAKSAEPLLQQERSDQLAFRA